MANVQSELRWRSEVPLPFITFFCSKFGWEFSYVAWADAFFDTCICLYVTVLIWKRTKSNTLSWTEEDMICEEVIHPVTTRLTTLLLYAKIKWYRDLWRFYLGLGLDPICSILFFSWCRTLYFGCISYYFKLINSPTACFLFSLNSTSTLLKHESLCYQKMVIP